MHRRIIYFVSFYFLIVNQLFSKSNYSDIADTLFVKIDYENKLYKLEKPTMNSIKIYTDKTVNTYNKIKALPDNDTSEMALILPSISVTPYSYFIYQSKNKVMILQKEFDVITSNKKVLDYLEFEKIKIEILVNTVVFFYETNVTNNTVIYYRVFEVHPD